MVTIYHTNTQKASFKILYLVFLARKYKFMNRNTRFLCIFLRSGSKVDFLQTSPSTIWLRGGAALDLQAG
jgi:hypothetical protein